MRFGLALLAAGPGKAGAQAIGEAGQALLAGKEKDKLNKKQREQEYLKELSTKLGLMTQGEKLLNPDSEFTDIARKLGLQDESYAKRLGMQENMQRRLLEAKRNATREEQNALKLRIEALKAAAAAGNMQAQEALARIGMGIGENEAVSTPEDDGETLGN
jgi:tRNA threonylcarbamoyladenosine modification (KEOPS) complex Cgi121 subunit